MEIEYPSLSDRVYEYLCNQIIDGNIKYGERLNIKGISEQLKVSTMPVRDALKKLEMENVVRIKPRSNCFVTIPTKKSILDAVVMREVLELHAAKLIYRTIADAELQPMQNIVADMKKIIEKEPTRNIMNRYIYLDLLFHTELCNLAGNDYLKKFYREVNLHLNMTFIYRIGTPPNIRESFRDHKRFVEKLSGNSPESLDLLAEHLERSKGHIVQGRLFQSLE
ncbi:MAG: GntR family transcriptional regulator [Spirochaetaceae bacterium]|nr:MAG: GntR family transcriptional regulator [Spirochaetaceae bacterium]